MHKDSWSYTSLATCVKLIWWLENLFYFYASMPFPSLSTWTQAAAGPQQIVMLVLLFGMIIVLSLFS